MPDPAPKALRVVISNGSNQFHLAPLAAEMARAGVLAGFFTSGWPTRLARTLVAPWANSAVVQRFLNRREAIPEALVWAFNGAEIFFQLGQVQRRLAKGRGHGFDLMGFRWYARRAARAVDALRPDVYHFRACYGLGSVGVARKAGAVTLCDHSLAHPGVLHYMVENEGRWPGAPATDLSTGDYHPLQPLMQADLAACDHVLVNSDFVRETCLFSGMALDRVHVVYLGVDDKFLESIPVFDEASVVARAGAPLLFAGGVQRRKGMEVLARALEAVQGDWRLRLVGGFEPGIEDLPGVRAWRDHPRVTVTGILPRRELPSQMAAAAIFVFPSYCEGSARVIFEAMACGCFVITTPNSGSIVEDGVHGRVVPPGDAAALATAIEWALAHPREVAAAGWRNAQLVREQYRQSQYGARVREVYRTISSSPRVTPPIHSRP